MSPPAFGGGGSVGSVDTDSSPGASSGSRSPSATFTGAVPPAGATTRDHSAHQASPTTAGAKKHQAHPYAVCSTGPASHMPMMPTAEPLLKAPAASPISPGFKNAPAMAAHAGYRDPCIRPLPTRASARPSGDGPAARGVSSVTIELPSTTASSIGLPPKRDAAYPPASWVAT